jgi:rhamnogalacturonan endolyase
LWSIAQPGSPAAHAAVSVADEGSRIVMGNGLIELTIDRGKTRYGVGAITSIRYNAGGGMETVSAPGIAYYLDTNGGLGPTHTTADAPVVHPFDTSCPSCIRVVKGSDYVETVIIGQESSVFPFETEAHYIVREGVPGFYSYVILRHARNMPAGHLTQVRYVFMGVPGTSLYTNHVVRNDNSGTIPTGTPLREIQDSTYLMSDGSVYTKYDNSLFTYENSVTGMAGSGRVGAWMVLPSTEFLTGGPIKQDLTVQVDFRRPPYGNIMQAILHSEHYGTTAFSVADGEAWEKLYGPVLVYFTHGGSVPQMWQEANAQARSEQQQWPYQWLRNPDYPLQRGSVRGNIALTDGEPTAGAWAILARPGDDWTQSAKGYEYWTRIAGDGSFVIPKVRAGTYTLWVSGANQFEDYHSPGNVTVAAGQAVDLGRLAWQPVTHGHRLWQIGRADRGTTEFRNGADARHYGNFLRYPRDFPNDVHFVVGQSRDSTDWNFAQWSWYNRTPDWTIDFTLDHQPTGNATLTMGFAAVVPVKEPVTHLRVQVNGTPVVPTLVNGAPPESREPYVELRKSGQAAYRSGSADSTYNLVYLTFDAGVLRAGRNQISLSFPEAQPFPPRDRVADTPLGAVMYDAIRLEAAP